MSIFNFSSLTVIIKFNCLKFFQPVYFAYSGCYIVIFFIDIVRSNGLECMVGCHPEVVDVPPKIGSLITVKHSGYFKNGALRNPFYWRNQGFLPKQDYFKSNPYFERSAWSEELLMVLRLVIKN